MTNYGFIVAEKPYEAMTFSKPASAASSPRDSRRSSAESATKDGLSLKSVTKRFVAAAKKHHAEVNRAFDSVYGTRFYK